MRHILLAFAMSMGFSALAQGQTQEQKNVMQHAAVLYVADKWCSEYTVDLATINRAASSAKIKPEREPFRAYLKEQIDKTQDALSDAGTKEGCSVLYTLYGPKGSAVSGQMMRK